MLPVPKDKTMIQRIPFPPPETSFVPGWAIGIPLLILVGVLVWWFIASMNDEPWCQHCNNDGYPCPRCKKGDE